MSNVCGTGGWSGPLPGDPDNTSVLTATPAFGGIDVSWTPAVINPHAVAHTILYRATNPTFNTAVRIATVGGTHFYDKLDNPIRYYYWIQIVSINGTYNDVIGPASAIPRLSIDATIEQLTGRIDNGVLAQSLKTEIDNITVIGADLLQEIRDRIAANELLGAALQTVQTGLDTTFSYLNTEITQRTEAYNVLLQTINTMAGQVLNNEAAIQRETQLRIDADSALAAETALLYAKKDEMASAILVESEARVAGDDALASQITTAQSTLGDNIASVQTSLQTNINTVAGEVANIGALYTAKVGVNGLIGGFGVYNDGTEVQAGFDVDTFWVGRTGPDKKKPFIIDSTTGEVFINRAVIQTLTADMIDTRGLTIKDASGNIILGSGTGLDWSRVSGTNKPVDGATRNKIFTQSAAPTSPADGDIWVDTSSSPAVTKVRVSDAWTTAANMTTNTNQLTDGAGLGTTATWTNVASRPTSLSGLNSTEGSKLSGIESGATKGASLGTNVFRNGTAIAQTDLLASWNKISTTNASSFFNSSGLPGTYIESLAASKITAGAIGVGQWISSTSYVAGSTGWAINANGSAEFNNVTVRGTIEASSLKANTAMVGTAHINNYAVSGSKLSSAVVITQTFSANQTLTFNSTFGRRPMVSVMNIVKSGITAYFFVGAANVSSNADGTISITNISTQDTENGPVGVAAVITFGYV